MIEATDHVLPGRWNLGYVGQGLSDRSSGDGQRVAVNQIVGQQDLHNLRSSAGTMQISGYVASRWLEVAQNRDPRANGGKGIPREGKLCRVGKRPQVEPDIGGAPL